MLTLLLIGCTNYVFTAPGAPFELGKLQTAAWAASPIRDGEGGAVLVLSDAEYSCDELMDDADAAFESVSVLGSALIFLFQQEFDGGKEPAADPYIGLWMDREPMVDDYERYLYALSYHDGMSYLLGGEESPGLSWVDLSSSEDGATGSFGTIYWNGDFEAEDCGSLSFGDDERTLDDPDATYGSDTSF